MKPKTSIIDIMFFLSLMGLSSCSVIPQVSSDIEKIADNDAIILKVDKDTFGISTDVHVIIDVINKEKP